MPPSQGDAEALLAEAEHLEHGASMGTGGADIDPGDAAEMRADMRRRAAELRERAKHAARPCS